MTIEVMGNYTEITSDEEFMRATGVALTEAVEFNDQTKLTIAVLHRDIEDEAFPTVLTFTTNESEGMFLNTKLSYDQVADAIEAVIAQTGKNKLPAYAFSKLLSVLMDVYNCEHDIRGLANEIRENVHENANFQGLVSEVTLLGTGDIAHTVTLTVNAEFLANTHAEEQALLKEKSLDPEGYQLSPENKFVQLFSMEVHSYEHING